MIDFGNIISYKRDRGFGFVTCTLSQYKQVFFHIKKIRKTSSELAQRLDSDEISSDINFWYEIEITRKGAQTREIWLRVENIPDQYAHELEILVQKVEEIWTNLNSSQPRWLEIVTINLVGESRKDELKIERLRQLEAKQNRDEIRRICHEKNIETLIHFTHISNLSSILQYGLIERSRLQEQGIKFRYNDDLRLDNQPDSVSLSISFPNYQMFYKYRKSNESDWVILLLNSCILYELKCKFYRDNAASNNSRLDNMNSDRTKSSALQEMFEDYRNIQRSQLNIPDNYTTHPQAEVLVLNSIPIKYIRCINFHNQISLNLWRSQHEDLVSEIEGIELNISRQFFSYRNDYPFWRGQSHSTSDNISESPF